jgi:DNA invertase Pin-like site-specific DNA recombinase
MSISPNNFFIYVRKSTDESNRQVLSIQAQLFELHEMARREGLTVIRTFEESRTAKQPGRPQFNLMMSEIEKGKAQGILAWHPDRLARNSIDGGRIVYLVDTGKIKDLRFPTFRFETSAHGKFMLNIAFSQSKYYVDNLSENIKRGIRQKLRNGIWPNRPPVGYFNDRNNRCIAVQPEKAKLVRKAFELYATGNFPLHEVRSRMEKIGFTSCTNKRMSISDYQWMYQNPFFYGVMEFNGEFYEGKHEPIISKRLFDRVQEVMAQKSKPKSSKLKPYLYRGLFRCGECGCFITAETQKGHNYLRCTKRVSLCTQKYVREEIIVTQVDHTIERVALESALADNIILELEQDRQTAAKGQEAAVARCKADLAAYEKQMDLLLDMRLNEQISEPEYISKKCILVNQKAELKGKLEAFEHNRQNRFEPAIAFIKEAKNATFLLAEGNAEQKRDFLKKIGSNFQMADKSLAVEFRKPWNLLAEFNSARSTPLAAGGENCEKSNWRCVLNKVRTFFEENPAV